MKTRLECRSSELILTFTDRCCFSLVLKKHWESNALSMLLLTVSWSFCRELPVKSPAFLCRRFLHPTFLSVLHCIIVSSFLFSWELNSKHQMHIWRTQRIYWCLNLKRRAKKKWNRSSVCVINVCCRSDLRECFPVRLTSPGRVFSGITFLGHQFYCLFP